jgi:hypothetical protein
MDRAQRRGTHKGEPRRGLSCGNDGKRVGYDDQSISSDLWESWLNPIDTSGQGDRAALAHLK